MTKEFREVRKDLSGPAAAPYIGPAREMLGELKQSMKLNDLKILSKTVDLPNGVRVMVQSVFGQDKISILAPTVSPEKTILPVEEALRPSDIVIVGRADNQAVRWVNGVIHGLGVLPGYAYSVATDVSANGRVVVGYSFNSTTAGILKSSNIHQSQAFAWTPTTGMIGLGWLAAPPGQEETRFFESLATGVSYDGKVIVGSDTVSVNNVDGFRWTGTSFAQLGSIDPDFEVIYVATGVNSDGDVIVGYDWYNGFQTQAFMWTPAAGTVGLGFIKGQKFNRYSTAYAVSGNGKVVVGYGYNLSSTDENGSPPQAFRWTAVDGMIGLGPLAGYAESYAQGVSRDGNVIAGYGWTGPGSEACIWTPKKGMRGIGFLPNTAFSFAQSVSSDGTILVGSSYNNTVDGSDSEAFIWSQGQGMTGLGFLKGGVNSFANAVTII